MDVVWLKKDVRLHDHAPLSLIAADGSSRPCLILFLYEPDQLSEKTVHGSHVAFVNEGLVDLDLRLSGLGGSIADSDIDLHRRHQFRCITVCRAGAAFTLRAIHRQRPIHQILCHMETSHLKSFARDKAVRRWCRANDVPIREFNQTGVTRCLSNRDDFSANFTRFLDQPMPETPSSEQLRQMRMRLIDVDAEGVQLHGLCPSPMNPADMEEIPAQHRHDRANRQRGGESKALDMFRSFLSRRGANYSSGISSPNTSWTTGSRLSPYLTWGHISLRHVIVNTKRRQEELRSAKKVSSSPSPWLRSLASFQSRIHWRSHFMQKLESQPSLEKEDLCLAFSQLRRQPHDFCQEHYDAWCQGLTGFPFVDACMRCLLDCGWLNFRMRAMLVSFATYNLWLDWKKISCHLARVFLDYEPGIHYPQLQMQAGTTGINAMRVYNVTKQGRDQDPSGTFIRRYVPELRNVPDEYIHEPYHMPASMQRKFLVTIGDGDDKVARLGFPNLKRTSSGALDETDGKNCFYYPSPIVDEKATSKLAKDMLSAVRKQGSTKPEADKVFEKHGSRRFRGEDRDGVKPKALSSAVKRVRFDKGQTSLPSSWKFSSHEERKGSERDHTTIDDGVLDERSTPVSQTPYRAESSEAATSKPGGEWSCKLCTYLNEKPLALACGMCGSVRQ